MGQYFDNVEGLSHKDILIRFSFLGKEYCLHSDNGVFSKDGLDDGTRLLLETIAQADLGTSILDVGCGVGPIGLILASVSPERSLTLIDVNDRALALAKQNASDLGVSQRVQIQHSDVYHSIDSIYDTIVTNPPIRAGKKVTYAIYEGGLKHLKEGGKLLLVIRVKQGAYSALAYISSLYKKTEILAKKKGYLVLQAIK
ncbi:MAG TPA: 16S rRNA methyltransferase [Firmicutes bacterium]|nr:16S rRNA methyltransferase [Bacillota bacterium]